jgi:hypothetical protein
MQRDLATLDQSDRGDQLARLLLRVIAGLSPCTEDALLAYVGGGSFGYGAPEAGPRQRQLVHKALIKLLALGLIEMTDEKIVLANPGWPALDLSASSASSNRTASTAAASGTVDEIGRVRSGTLLQIAEAFEAARGMPKLEAEAWVEAVPKPGIQLADVPVAAGPREVDGVESPTSVRQMHDLLAARFEPASGSARWTRMASQKIAPFAHALSEYGSRLNRFGRDRLAKLRAADWRHASQSQSARAPRNLAAPLGPQATLLAHRIAPFAIALRRRGARFALRATRWQRQVMNEVRRAASAPALARALPRARLAAFYCPRWLISGGAAFFVLIGASLATLTLFQHPASTPASQARSSIVWQFDHGGLPAAKHSVFVTRKVGARTWIEGFSIHGENTSGGVLSAVQGSIKPDNSDVDLKLGVIMSLVGDEPSSSGAVDIPPGAYFSLRYAFRPTAPGQPAGIAAEDFFARYGGAVFAVSYTLGGVHKTEIEYLSSAQLKAQLEADAQ